MEGVLQRWLIRMQGRPVLLLGEREASVIATRASSPHGSWLPQGEAPSAREPGGRHLFDGKALEVRA